jgi:hypothetical protein
LYPFYLKKITVNKLKIVHLGVSGYSMRCQIMEGGSYGANSGTFVRKSRETASFDGYLIGAASFIYSDPVEFGCRSLKL